MTTFHNLLLGLIRKGYDAAECCEEIEFLRRLGTFPEIPAGDVDELVAGGLESLIGDGLVRREGEGWLVAIPESEQEFRLRA